MSRLAPVARRGRAQALICERATKAALATACRLDYRKIVIIAAGAGARSRRPDAFGAHELCGQSGEHVMSDALEMIRKHASSGASLREEFFGQNAENIRNAAFMAALALARGHKILLCGNGGSAADAQHVAGELVNRFLMDRPALPAIALTVDTSVLTAIGNDFHFDLIFRRQLEALGAAGDVLLAISTSGNSANVINAIQCAREKGIAVIGLTGRKGGAMADMCDVLINAASESTPLIQEMHLACEHIFCALIDYYLFENVAELRPYLPKPED